MTQIVRLSQTEIEKETGIKEAFRTPARGITRTEQVIAPRQTLESCFLFRLIKQGVTGLLFWDLNLSQKR